ncbi:uncharacterized protein CLUP02_14293 [Colletotrichum lupini]|uniref:Uncharacterized protein n=1 Tax=Colletotrichum lupini TaxID=145971 RepID=A0A9Q8T409_9PEZI|nr:uncharacterized protein CLUP02_14293 [Colletotrichum lupini]UQC88768.1 hypothetical protein CLUP02_14293 [Colletotrichum lupini]
MPTRIELPARPLPDKGLQAWLQHESHYGRTIDGTGQIQDNGRSFSCQDSDSDLNWENTFGLTARRLNISHMIAGARSRTKFVDSLTIRVNCNWTDYPGFYGSTTMPKSPTGAVHLRRCNGGSTRACSDGAIHFKREETPKESCHDTATKHSNSPSLILSSAFLASSQTTGCRYSIALFIRYALLARVAACDQLPIAAWQEVIAGPTTQDQVKETASGKHDDGRLSMDDLDTNSTHINFRSLSPSGQQAACQQINAQLGYYNISLRLFFEFNMNFNILFWFFLLGATSVYASTCTVEPRSNFDSRFDSSFAKQAKQQCRSAGGNSKGGNSVRQVCDFRGDPPRSLQRTSRIQVSSNGRSTNVNRLERTRGLMVIFFIISSAYRCFVLIVSDLGVTKYTTLQIQYADT